MPLRHQCLCRIDQHHRIDADGNELEALCDATGDFARLGIADEQSERDARVLCNVSHARHCRFHVGMSDLTVFRFARKSWYSVASAAGMYVGHFMAWLCASILYAYQLHLDTANTDVLPGPLAYRAAGLAGLLCVVIAGWTTANPTIYRAGLAFQALAPRSSRFTVTLITGGVATVAGMFPAIAMKLLGFVALYGMLLMPMGAIVFVDFWLMRKFGLRSSYAQVSGTSFNWAAALTWFLTLGACWGLVQLGGVQIFFVSLPGWFVAAVLYVVLSRMYQRRPSLA